MQNQKYQEYTTFRATLSAKDCVFLVFLLFGPVCSQTLCILCIFAFSGNARVQGYKNTKNTKNTRSSQTPIQYLLRYNYKPLYSCILCILVFFVFLYSRILVFSGNTRIQEYKEYKNTKNTKNTRIYEAANSPNLQGSNPPSLQTSRALPTAATTSEGNNIGINQL